MRYVIEIATRAVSRALGRPLEFRSRRRPDLIGEPLEITLGCGLNDFHLSAQCDEYRLGDVEQVCNEMLAALPSTLRRHFDLTYSWR